MTRVFFATDVHGSEKTFRKFVNSAKFYKADVLVLGGDITGKIIIPMVRTQSGDYTIFDINEKIVVRNEQDLAPIEERIRRTGYYPFRTTTVEYEKLQQDQKELDRVFSGLMVESIRRWIDLTKERLENTNVKVFVTPGNDDRMEIDEVFDKSSCVVNPEGKVVRIDENHEMISTGYTNITPWKAPRDINDDELSERIQSMIGEVENVDNCIFNFHCPPWNSELDKAPELDKDLKPIISYGQVVMSPAGSKAVREAIEKNQPMLGLHGHIHESRGISNIGRTICVNPGSEYSEGILRGAVIDIDKKKVKNCILTSG